MRAVPLVSAAATLSERYTIRRLLQSNSFHTMAAAYDKANGKPVVIKMSSHACPSVEQHVLMCYGLAYEASMLRVLEANSVQAPRLYDFLHIGQHACLVMQFIAGETLEVAAEYERLRPARVASITDDIASILQRTHGLGYVHHDVKPSNIMVQPSGRALLIDWGAATRIRAPEVRSGYVIWTEGFASFEQRCGMALCTNDIFALGKTLEAVCPFLTARLARVVSRATATLSQRYTAIADLRTDLAPLLWPWPQSTSLRLLQGAYAA